MGSDEPFNYHHGLWLLLSHFVLIQTCSKLRNDSIEDSEVDKCLKKKKRKKKEKRIKKNDFADLKDAKSNAGFFFSSPISSRME